MPLYLRKQPFDIPPPTEKDWIKKDDEDFSLHDPNDFLDSLPQPFCMINKIVKLLFERAWELIEGTSFNLQKKKRQSFTPLLCQPSTKFTVTGKVNCLAASGGYIFIGLSTGISVYSAIICKNLCAWEATKLEICTIQVSDLGGDSHLLGTVDEMGFAHLFCFVKENLLHIKSINEVEDISKRNACMALELSHGSDYAGFLLQGSSEAWLEIYRLPKDSWQKETEHLHTVAFTAPGFIKETKASQPLLLEKSMQKNTDIQGTEDMDLQQLLSKIESKLVAPVLLLKVRSPKPLSGEPHWVQWDLSLASIFKSPSEALMKSDDGSVTGLGYNPMIRDCQLEQLEEIFSSRFQQYLETENELESKEEKPSHAKFHFHLPGRTLPIGAEIKAEPEVPVAFSVHWSQSHNLCFYHLSRPPKEKADSDPKPDLVCPCAAAVACSTVSSCSSYLAFACEDKIITVWDVSVGFPLSVMVLPESYNIRDIQFMPCLNKHPASTKVKLLVLCTDGSLHLLTSGPKEFNCNLLGLRRIGDLFCLEKYNLESPQVPSQTVSAMATISTLPDAVLIFSWNGIISLMDTGTEEINCQFRMPSSHKVASPWQPVFSMDTNGRWLVVQGNEQSKANKVEMDTIFLFDFNSYPFMDTFAANDENPPDALAEFPWDQHCELFLNSNLQRLSTINHQMPECWSQLQEYAVALKRKMCGELKELEDSRSSEEVISSEHYLA